MLRPLLQPRPLPLLPLLQLPSLLLLTLLCAARVAEAEPIWSDRFTPFWNVPSERCHGKFDVAMPLREYHIVHNAGFRFRGDQVVLFYEYQSGLFPYYENLDVKRPVNGGLPQNVDLAAHLAILEDQILTHIPDEAFNGPAVIDVEEWRPMYHLNWGSKTIYKEESERLVQKRYPSMSLKSVKIVAEEEFNRAAKKLLTLSLQLARRLRPNAKWSMYGFPYCNYDAGLKGESHCAPNYCKHNDRLRWLTDEFTALSPSIYLDALANNTSVNYRYIYAVLDETRRIAVKEGEDQESSPGMPIVPFTKFEYNPYEHEIEKHIYYSKRDLCNSLKLASDLGAAGVLIWSTDRTLNKDRCHTIRTNVAHSLGPAADLVRRRANRCALDQCSGNGRCILRAPTNFQDKCTFRMPPSDYKCKCDAGYYGDRCERMHNVVDADSGSGSGTTVGPEFTVAVPGFIQGGAEEEEEQTVDPLASRVAALKAGIVPPVREFAPSIWANRIDPNAVPPPTAASPEVPPTPPGPLPVVPTHFNVNDNREDVPGLDLFTRIL